MASQVVTAEPQLEIRAVAGRDPIRPGEALVYTFAFGNLDDFSTEVTVTATTPPGTTFESANPVPLIAPLPGGVGAITWRVADLPPGRGGTVAMVVRADDGLAPGTALVLSGYQIQVGTPPAVVAGSAVAVEIAADLMLELVQRDEPDGVEPGGFLTYEVLVANRGGTALQGLVLRELFDPRLEVLAAEPPADPDTTDRWSIPFLPFGAVRTIRITAQVSAAALPGSVLHSVADVVDADGHAARSDEDTLVVAAPALILAVDDLPDPLRSDGQVTYTLTYGNQTGTDLSGVVLHAEADPRLSFVLASVPPDPGSLLSWTIGPLPAATAERIAATFAPTGPLLASGILLPLRAWIADDIGRVAGDAEVTLLTDERLDRSPYVLTLTGAPRTVRAGSGARLTYVIKLRHIGAEDTTGVRVMHRLPSGVEFVDAEPGPSAIDDNEVTYEYAEMVPGSTRMIVVKAALSASVGPGTLLVSGATVTDEEGNSAQDSFRGGVRMSRPEPPPPPPGPPPPRPPPPRPSSGGGLEVRVTVPGHVNAGSRLASTLSIVNTTRGETRDVVLTVDCPAALAFESAIPRASSQTALGDGTQRITWNFARINGPGNTPVRLFQRVGDLVPNGTVLGLFAEVRAADGADQESESVVVRNR